MPAWPLGPALWLLIGEIALGTAIGWTLGKLLGWLMFKWAGQISEGGDGLVALGIAACTFALADLARANGFVAAFVMALSLRSVNRDHVFHQRMAEFMELERLRALREPRRFGCALVHLAARLDLHAADDVRGRRQAQNAAGLSTR